jgi:glycosyltransferase involved in cell wall biosynthesis
MQLAIDLHSLTTSTPAGKHHYTRSLVDAVLAHPEAQHHSFDLITAAPLSPPSQNSNSEITKLTSGPSFYPHLIHHLHRTKPDLFISPTSFISTVISPTPTISIIYDFTALETSRYQVNRKAKIIETLLLPHIICRSAGLITLDESITKELHHRFQKQTPPTITISGFSRLQKPQKTPPRLYQQPYLLTVSTLEPRKNLINLIRAYTAFKKTSPHPPDLIIAGAAGWHHQSIFQEIAHSPVKSHIHTPGYISESDLTSLYFHAHGFVFIPKAEGFGLPLIEALSFNLPCLISQIEPLTTIAGSAALTAPADNVPSITKQLHLLTNHPPTRKKLITLTSSRTRLFTPTKSADQLYKLIKKIKP